MIYGSRWEGVGSYGVCTRKKLGLNEAVTEYIKYISTEKLINVPGCIR